MVLQRDLHQIWTATECGLGNWAWEARLETGGSGPNNGHTSGPGRNTCHIRLSPFLGPYYSYLTSTFCSVLHLLTSFSVLFYLVLPIVKYFNLCFLGFFLASAPEVEAGHYRNFCCRHTATEHPQIHYKGSLNNTGKPHQSCPYTARVTRHSTTIQSRLRIRGRLIQLFPLIEPTFHPQ